MIWQRHIEICSELGDGIVCVMAFAVPGLKVVGVTLSWLRVGVSQTVN